VSSANQMGASAVPPPNPAGSAVIGASVGKTKPGMPRFVTTMLISFFVACTAFFVLVVGYAAWHEIHPGSQGVAATPSDTKEQVLSVKLDSYSKEAEEIEKLTGFLTGLAALYAVALGIGSYLGLQQNLQQAQMIADQLTVLHDKAVKQVDESADKTKEVVHQIRDEFPLFGYVDTNLRRITKQLVEILPFQGWSGDIYTNLKLNPSRIQEILYYEKTAASLEFFEQSSIRMEVSQIYDGLGDFYALKALDERSSGKNIDDDRNRSLFYLERATLANYNNYAAWNDRAWIALVLEVPANYPVAKQYSETSLNINANQQRALYNLGVCENELKHYFTVESLMSRALTLVKWQEAKNEGRFHNLYYNRACARSRLSENLGMDEKKRSAARLLDQALEDLKKGLVTDQLKYWDARDWEDLTNDFLNGGDLEAVRRAHRAEIIKLMSQDIPAVPADKREEALKRLEKET